MPDSPLTLVFAHGKESGPAGTKISYLTPLAQARGWQVESPDFRFTQDPDRRVEHLAELLNSHSGRLVLAGSSLGGYVCAQACARLHVDGLFLMAPALYFPAYDTEPQGIPARSTVVHGWQDEVVPPERAIRFAATHRAELHLLRSGHTLTDRLDDLATALTALLDQVAAA